jgi:hypothetical protein
VQARFIPCAGPDLSRQNTLAGGVRITNPAVGFGTLGAIATDVDTGALVGLTCFHVAGLPSNLFPFTVWQPDNPAVGVIGGSPPDPGDNIGHVIRVDFPQTVTPTFPPQVNGFVDAAIVALDEARTQRRAFSRAILADIPPALLVDRVTRTVRSVIGQEVRKRGFETGVTFGRVIATGITRPWTVDGAPPLSQLFDQAEILPTDQPSFCEKGDSGSLVLDRFAPTAVGLLWGKNGGRGVMSEITTVETRLRVSLV